MKSVNESSSSSEALNKSVETSSCTTKTSKKKILVIVVGLVLLSVIGALAAAVVVLLNNEEDNEAIKLNGTMVDGRGTIVTLDNKDEVLADLDKTVSSGLFQIKMNNEWTFEDGSKPSKDAYVANATTNTNTVYFTITLDSTGEVVYDSPYIPVGYAMTDITLLKDLSAGTHTGTLTYHLVDENKKELSALAVNVIMKVLN